MNQHEQYTGTMNIHFCDICNESVPQIDLDENRALIHNGRVVCANCDAAMSKAAPGGFESRSTHLAPAPSPAGVPAPVYTTTAPGSSAVAVMGLLLATLGIVLLAVAAVFGMDRLAGLNDERSGEIAALRAELAGVARSLEVEVSNARQSNAATGAEVTGRVAQLGDEVRAAGERQADDVKSLRAELAQLRALLGAESKTDAAVRANEGRIKATGEELAELRDDLAVIARRLLDVEQLGPAAGQMMSATATPPKWMPIVEDLDDPNAGNRYFAVTELADSGDTEVVPYLIPMLKDEDIFVRMATARILGALGAQRAVGALIDTLEDPETSVREAAVVALRVITGNNLKFDPFAGEGERSRRVKAWREWWQKSGPVEDGA